MVSVFAHIAKSQAYEAIMEEKQKRVDKEPKKNKDIPRTSKRQKRLSLKREEHVKPVLEIVMEEVLKEKKKGPSLRLKSNIELMTDIQKVFEERILNSKVEMQLVELLAIVKPEFHSMFNNLTKRKRHAIENPNESIKVSNILF